MRHEILRMFIVLKMRLLILRTSKNKRRGICTDIVIMGKPLHKFGLEMEGKQIVDSNMNQSFGLVWNYV
jgi:hypothetical protein